MSHGAWCNLGGTLAARRAPVGVGSWLGFGAVGDTRIQLCGPLVARVAGERVDGRLPGRQGRLLFAYLVLERRTVTTREALVDLLWGEAPPEAADAALSALLSKLRRIVPVEGRSEVRIGLPADAWVDVEAASEAVHRAESCAAREDWPSTWGPARVAQHVSERSFLPGEVGLWVSVRRRGLEALRIRALELAGVAAMHIGGGELATAERTAERLVELAPLRESGTRLLMEVHAARGNRAEALLAYEALRLQLRDELGVGPSAETVEAHRRLLA
jgi:DNA-binding SARP family transcriptional activator